MKNYVPQSVEVPDTKFKAVDGSLHDSHEQALHHGKIIQGTRRVCLSCHGEKKVPDCGNFQLETCRGCNGKGWQEKSEVWK